MVTKGTVMGNLGLWQRSRPALRCVSFAIGLTAIGSPMFAQSGESALVILQAMSNYIDAQQSLSLPYDSDIEVIPPQFQKLQFASSGTV